MFPHLKKLLGASLGLVLLVAAGCGGAPAANKAKDSQEAVTLHVSAAASLTDAMKEMQEAYKAEHPNVDIVFNFGSSGALEQVIENGGETDLFFSAAQKQMDQLEKAGDVADGTRKDLLENEVVLIALKDAGNDVTSWDELATPAVTRIALGEPKGVPVGQYSEEILKHLDLWDKIQSKVVFGSDVRQVLSWVETGNAEVGMVYATDAAVSDKVKVVLKAPEGSHKPVIYPAAVIKSSKNIEAAKEFLAFASSDKGKEIFEKYGFQVK